MSFSMHVSTLFYVMFVCMGVVSIGTTTNSTEAPEVPNLVKVHLVNILFKNDFNEVYFLCYGVKFRPYHFLTTASCFDKFRGSGKLSIRENTVHVSSVQRPNGPLVYVVGVLEHPRYNIVTNNGTKKERSYDLAILRVAENLDEITTAVVLPDATPQYGATKCSLTVFKDTMNPNELVEMQGNVQPTKDCLSNETANIFTSFCVQLKQNLNQIKEEYMTAAPVTCNHTDTVFGVFSWGYDSNSEINNLLVTSFASHLEWISAHQDEKFPLPGETGNITEKPTSTSTSTSTSSTTPSKPTPTNDPGHSNSTSGSTENPMDNDDDDGSVGLLPLSPHILLIIAICVLTH